MPRPADIDTASGLDHPGRARRAGLLGVYLWVPAGPGGGLLELAGDPDEQVFPPVRRDPLYADRPAEKFLEVLERRLGVGRDNRAEVPEEFRLEHRRGRGLLDVVAERLE